MPHHVKVMAILVARPGKGGELRTLLDGRHDPEHVALAQLMKPFPVAWGHQLQSF